MFLSFGYPEVRFLRATGNRLFIQQQDLNPTDFRAVNNQLKQDLNNILETDKFNNLRFVQTGSTRGPGGGSQRWKRAFVIKVGDNYYSERNFSFGEILVLNTLLLITDVPNNSMLLIDELEIAVHPRVQLRLLEYLESKACEKNLTIILSTHSSSIIKSARRIIYLENNGAGNIQVFYKAYPALVLKEIAIEEDIQPDYVFFVEDDMAEMLLKEMIFYYFKLENNRIIPIFKILPIGGYKQVLEFAKKSRGYLFNAKIGQYVFPDKDVEQTYQDLRRKGNNRGAKEQSLFELFTDLSPRTTYLPITPELGVWDWIGQNTSQVQSKINEYYQGNTLILTDLIRDTNNHFSNNSNDTGTERKKAKRRIKYLVELISERVNENSKRINQYFFRVFVDDFYSNSTNRNTLRNIFDIMFNRRGN